MTPSVTLAAHGLDLHFGDIRESRPLTLADSNLLADWAKRHRQLASDKAGPGDQLLALGQEIYGWLNSADKFLERMLLNGAPPPLLMTFLTTLDTDDARRFLDAPWELLAGPTGGHWALRQELQFCPVRRLHRAGQPPIPSAFRLNVIFMAAAPRGADNLAYEAEEAAILRATRRNQVDLVVEESGELEQLAVTVPLRHPDVVHLSCHGALKLEPVLVLETDTGDPDFVPASRLVSQLGNPLPKLLFLSACETAQADPVLDSLSRSLVRCGAPACSSTEWAIRGNPAWRRGPLSALNIATPLWLSSSATTRRGFSRR